MGTWATHKLANPLTSTLELSVRERCIAKVDLPGVPAGTPGRVILANGFNRLRYWVRFENGVELSNLDGRHLDPVPSRRRRKREQKAG